MLEPVIDIVVVTGGLEVEVIGLEVELAGFPVDDPVDTFSVVSVSVLELVSVVVDTITIGVVFGGSEVDGIEVEVRLDPEVDCSVNKVD